MLQTQSIVDFAKIVFVTPKLDLHLLKPPVRTKFYLRVVAHWTDFPYFRRVMCVNSWEGLPLLQMQ